MTRETYSQLKSRHEKEYNEFSKDCVFFAFSNKQFEEGMEKLGLKPDETDKIYSIGHGGFILRTKSKEQNEMFLRFIKEHQQAIDNDTDGSGYIKEMFEYEMGNHEFGYTGDITDTLEALSLTMEEIRASETLSNGYALAYESYRKHYCED